MFSYLSYTSTWMATMLSELCASVIAEASKAMTSCSASWMPLLVDFTNSWKSWKQPILSKSINNKVGSIWLCLYFSFKHDGLYIFPTINSTRLIFGIDCIVTVKFGINLSLHCDWLHNLPSSHDVGTFEHPSSDGNQCVLYYKCIHCIGTRSAPIPLKQNALSP